MVHIIRQFPIRQKLSQSTKNGLKGLLLIIQPRALAY